MKTLQKLLLFSFFLFLFTAFTGCQIPKDPKRTFERVKAEKVFRVGVIENGAWVKKDEAGEPTGVEAELVKEFAQNINVRPEWISGGEYELFEALKNFEIDMIIGGLVESSSYSKHAAFTNPYFTERIVVGTPKDEILQDVAGRKVYVETGSVAAYYLKEKNAQPVETENPFQSNAFVAAPEWLLAEKGFQPADIELYKLKHVIAVPPGENLWLVTLENFLAENRTQIESMLKEGSKNESSLTLQTTRR